MMIFIVVLFLAYAMGAMGCYVEQTPLWSGNFEELPLAQAWTSMNSGVLRLVDDEV